ncbi:MAG TPA: hypothetical protein VE978_05230 [Chitinophagales bacterium]|nr:hypothetical protein [Chitinophagales bacterium]
MKNHKVISVIFLGICVISAINSCNNNSDQPMAFKTTSLFDDDCKSPLACKLTSSEMQQRKAKVLALLQKNVKEKKELENGYAYKFQGSDAMIDTLTSFIKTEKECCDFFTFNLAVRGDQDFVWLQLTGPKGTKDFIKTELEL